MQENVGSCQALSKNTFKSVHNKSARRTIAYRKLLGLAGDLGLSIRGPHLGNSRRFPRAVVQTHGWQRHTANGSSAGSCPDHKVPG